MASRRRSRRTGPDLTATERAVRNTLTGLAPAGIVSYHEAMLIYRINARDRIVEIAGLPTGEPDENVRFLNRILADPEYQPDFGFLRDRRGLAPLSVDEATKAAGLAEAVPALRGKRWAIVVDDLVNYGTSRMQQTIAEWHGLEVRIFNSIADARAWLTTGHQPTAELA